MYIYIYIYTIYVKFDSFFVKLSILFVSSPHCKPSIVRNDHDYGDWTLFSQSLSAGIPSACNAHAFDILFKFVHGPQNNVYN